MREFNLEEAKAGKPICTRSGRPARIICFDAKNEHYPIVVLVEEEKGKESLCNYCLNGRYNYGLQEENSYDLFMKPEKHKGWVNIVDDGHGNHVGTCIWKTREEAENHKPLFCVATTKIEWEE